MGVTRQYVFPALRIVVWAVIAAALVKIAFTGAELDPPDALTPTGELTESVVEVETGTVTNTVTVPASVVADPAVELRSTASGQISTVHRDQGKVAKGDDVVVVRFEEPREPLVEVDEETGEETVTERDPLVTYTLVEATRGGTLALTVLEDQEVAVGDVIGTITPGTLSAQGTLTPEQQYRLIGASDDAELTLKGGPAPFTCKDVAVGATSGSPAAEDGSEQAASGTVTCRIPKKVTAFPGQGAEIVITNGDATDVVVVPTTAVLGTTQNGTVWVSDAGEHVEREVELGLTDGVQVEVVSGLAAGEQILEFTPVEDGTEGGDVDCEDMAAYDEAAMTGDADVMTAFEEACF